MNKIVWEDVDPHEFAEPPDLPHCDKGPGGHRWTLEIIEGSVALGLAEGEECVPSIVDPDGNVIEWSCEAAVLADGTDLLGSVEFLVTVEFNPDHPGLGGWHGLTPCDCGWTWLIKPATEELV